MKKLKINIILTILMVMLINLLYCPVARAETKRLEEEQVVEEPWEFHRIDLGFHDSKTFEYITLGKDDFSLRIFILNDQGQPIREIPIYTDNIELNENENAIWFAVNTYDFSLFIEGKPLILYPNGQNSIKLRLEFSNLTDEYMFNSKLATYDNQNVQHLYFDIELYRERYTIEYENGEYKTKERVESRLFRHDTGYDENILTVGNYRETFYNELEENEPQRHMCEVQMDIFLNKPEFRIDIENVEEVGETIEFVAKPNNETTSSNGTSIGAMMDYFEKLGIKIVKFESALGQITTNTDDGFDEKAIGTGCKLTDETGKIYTAIVYGDVSGDGQIDAEDISKAIDCFLGEDLAWSMEYEIAGDLQQDGEIDAADMAIMVNYFLGNLEGEILVKNN